MEPSDATVCGTPGVLSRFRDYVLNTVSFSFGLLHKHGYIFDVCRARGIHVRPTIALITALMTAGCDLTTDAKCNAIEIDRIVPAETTIAVGQATTLAFEEQTCSKDWVPRAATWTTPDSDVVALDRVTGGLVGRRVGDARVSEVVHGQSVIVHVR
jgi:hypothetical protein